MARKLRLEFAGAIHHLVSRGNRHQVVFADEEDRALFLRTLGEACDKTRWNVRAFCLMRDHIHLVVETRQPNLATGMKWLLGTYAARSNRRHQLTGHLFSSRYKSIVIDGNGSYLQTAVDFVHLNPARAGLLEPHQPLSSYQWSSLPAFLSPANARPAWLRVSNEAVSDTRAGRTKLEERLEALRAGCEPSEFAELRRGWCFGGPRLRRRLLGLINEQAGASHYGAELREAAEARAEALVVQIMKELGWREGDLLARAKGDPGKVRIARRVRAGSDVTLEWIAKRLHMGARTYLAHLLYWEQRERGTPAQRRKLGNKRAESIASQPGRRSVAAGKADKRTKASVSAGSPVNSILLTDPIGHSDGSGSQPLAGSSVASPGRVFVAEIGFDPSFD